MYNMMAIFPNLNFHHNLTNFRHHHILDENELDISSQLFITFGVKSITLMGNSSVVQFMVFNISNVSSENIIFEIVKNFFEMHWHQQQTILVFCIAPPIVQCLHLLVAKILICVITSCIYHRFILTIAIDHCNSSHGEETSTWLKKMIIHKIQ